MKKTAVLIAVIAVLQLAGMSLWAISQTIAKPFTIGTKNANSMDVQFKVPDYEIEKDYTGGKTWDKVKIQDAGYLFDKGLPELPVLSTTIAIPNHGSVELELVNTHTKMIQHILPYPSQDGVTDNSNRDLYVNRAFYDGSTDYPQQVVQISEPQVIRDFRIVTIQIQPFTWNAATHELEVREQVDFRLHFTSTRGVNELDDAPLAISPSFEHIYESTILNFDDYRGYLMANTPPRYLMIYGAYTDATFMTKINEFVFWKKQKGADVRLVSTTVTGNTTTSIKTFIQNNYNDINTRPDYIVLIGDVTGSFSIPTYTESFSGLQGHGDYPYTHLAGNDLMGDVFIGRISAESTSQLDIILSKTYFYEKNINVATAQWLNRQLLVGDTNPSGMGLQYVMKNIKDMASLLNPDFTYNEQYGDPTPASMDAGINAGVGFFWYRGWIGMSGWNPGGSLINGVKVPHAIIVTCGTGVFAQGTSTTESFVRGVGTAAVPAGAVTAIGMETSHTNPMCNNILERGMAAGIFANGMRTMGESLLNGKLLNSIMYGQNHTLVANYSSHWCNLIGDPTMEVFTGIPGTFTTNAPDSLPNGTSYLDLTVLNQDSEPVKGACVTISQSNIIMARGYTDASGKVYLFINSSLNSGGAVVTVSKHDYKPLQETIIVTAGGSLVSSQPLIDDDAVGASIGNGNALANSGETLEILFAIRNSTVNQITNVTGSVSSSSLYATVINDSLNFLTIEPATSNYSIIPALVHISAGCPNNTAIRFDINLTDSNNLVYVAPVLLTVTDAFMTYVSNSVMDGGNMTLDPNESAAFTVTLRNTGTVSATALYGQLVTQNDLVQILDNTAYFGDVEAGLQVTAVSDTFRIQGRAQMLPGMQIPMRVRVYNAAGYSQWVDFTLTVGTAASTNPVGPDTHGYVIYDITDTSYEDCPTYSWVPIAPAEGGQGTLMTYSDNSVDGEGDAVGAVSCQTINLPFSFVFYGIPYTTITVSSNGFIAMGTTENGNWANCPIPGWGGPAPMIAPFWDDLITASGGVYRWYDATNHRYIVEWYNMKNGFNQSSIETFEVMLYDQAYYTTSMGDGPIKIQYNTFNNVDYVWEPNNTGSVSGTGNYSTIGIQNGDLSQGLQYSFNNTYAPAAAPLGNQKALYITNAPVYHYTPYLMYDSAYVHDNNNNVLEPNETLDLFINLANIGEQTAHGVTATLTSTSSFVTVLANNSAYPPIAQDSTGVNLTPYRIFVSPDCVDNQILPFTIAITTDTNFWQRSFNLTVEKPSLAYESYMINDRNGNNNGVADPGEIVTLTINAKNTSLVDAHNLTGTLGIPTVDVYILNNPNIFKSIVGAGEIIQFNYPIQVDSTFTPGNSVLCAFHLVSSDAPTVDAGLNIQFATPGMVLDMEANDGYFVSESGWTFGTPTQTTPHSGTHLWATNLSESYANNANYILKTPTITLGENASLSFWHMLACQNYYDGGNVTISTDGGTNWTLLYPVGGYNTSFSIYSLGEYGYTNNIGWNQATFDLSTYANQDVLIRWRFASNPTVASSGWFIDDVMVSGYSIVPGVATGTVTVGTPNVDQVKILTDTHILTNPDSTGVYTVYLNRGEYSMTASLPYHTSQSTPSFTISGDQLVYNYDFNLSYMANPTDLAYVLTAIDSTVVLTWTAPQTAEPVLGYNIYRHFGEGTPFEMLVQTDSPNYTDNLVDPGWYYYYVTARYALGEGIPSNEISFEFQPVGNNDPEQVVWVNSLQPNYPNPFNPMTTINFSMAKGGNATLKIFNTKGQLVRTLANSKAKAGKYSLVWNGKDNTGKTVSSGLYFYRLDAPGYSKIRKMMLLK